MKVVVVKSRVALDLGCGASVSPRLLAVMVKKNSPCSSFLDSSV